MRQIIIFVASRGSSEGDKEAAVHALRENGDQLAEVQDTRRSVAYRSDLSASAAQGYEAGHYTYHT